MAVNSPADACSGMWYDEEGNLLVAAFANRIEAVLCSVSPLRRIQLPILFLMLSLEPDIAYYEGAENRTMADVLASNPSKIHYDGIPVS